MELHALTLAARSYALLVRVRGEEGGEEKFRVRGEEGGEEKFRVRGEEGGEEKLRVRRGGGGWGGVNRLSCCLNCAHCCPS